jgi:hypothetical protein
MTAPLLAFIGAQITYLVFHKKIEANRAAYQRWEMKRRQAHLARQKQRKASGYGGPERRGGKPAPAPAAKRR